jgi:hypothetical protein
MAAPTPFPSKIATIAGFDRGLVATAALRPLTTVARFEGPVVAWRDVPDAERRYVLMMDDDIWMIPQSDARYVNHSCEPNCRIDNWLQVVTTRAVAAGEHLTIHYDALTMAEWVRAPRCYFWDDSWSFDCRCGAPGCVGRVNRYRIRSHEEPTPVVPAAKLRLGVVPGLGRGVFATAPIAVGEVFERAPVIVSPASEWPNLEKSIIFEYCFGWGPKLEHTAIGLGFAALYNHSYTPNATYVRQLDDLLIHFIALRDIAVDEEIRVNYNNDPTSRAPLWFAVR